MSETLMPYVRAFLVGGTICLIGQLLIDYTKLTPARILVSFVVIGVILGGLGWYQPLIDYAGAGASVPLTGFGSLLAKGVKEAVREHGFMGIFMGGLTATAAGITIAVLAGLVISLMFKPGDKS
ncbi:SpoVAC/SpoVAEB sporulation membrane protein [anaerobic digester metagenome]